MALRPYLSLEQPVLSQQDQIDGLRLYALLTALQGDINLCLIVIRILRELSIEDALLLAVGQALSCVGMHDQFVRAAEIVCRRCQTPQSFADYALSLMGTARREELEDIVHEGISRYPFDENLCALAADIEITCYSYTMLPIREYRGRFSTRSRYYDALHLIRSEQFDFAVEILEPLLNDYPGNAVVWHEYARTLSALNRLPEAIQATKRAIEIMPEQFPLREGLVYLTTRSRNPKAMADAISGAASCGLRYDASRRALLQFAKAHNPELWRSERS